MKQTYLIVALVFGFAGTNAMNHESRVRLSEKKLVKLPDKKIEFYQNMCKKRVILNIFYTAGYLTPLAFRKARQCEGLPVYLGCCAMLHTIFSYNDLRAYNLAKQGLIERREIIVE